MQKRAAWSGYSPLDASDEEDQVAVDLGAVDKLVNVAGIHCLSCQQAARPNAIANCKIATYTVASYFLQKFLQEKKKRRKKEFLLK